MSLLALWRKKARPEEVGAYLTDYVVKPVGYYRENMEPWVEMGLDSRNVLGELFMLQVFSVDYAVSLAVRDAQSRKSVMETFWTYLPGQVKDDILTGLLDDMYSIRRKAYLHGVGECPSTPTSGVGSAFASRCDSSDEERIAEQAAVEFATTVTAITRFLMRVKLRPARACWQR